jgi:ankyrin repeat protein
MIPAEWYRTPVGEGEFTCCKLGHVLETPTGQVHIDCDKVKVASVLETMFNNKVDSLLAENRLLEWRWLMARRQTLFSNLPHEYSVFRPSTLSEFLRDFRFSSITDGAESGWTPLRFAVIAKDAGVVKELLEQGSDPSAMLTEPALDLYHQQGQTILHTAATFGSRDVIELLVLAGADLTPALGK